MKFSIIYKRDVFNQILPYLHTRDIVVLHGARQVGKTHILYHTQNYLRQKGDLTHYIDLEDSRFVRLLNEGVDSFFLHLREEGFDLKKKVHVFIDEIQYLAHPSSFLKLIADHQPNIKLIVSGSSSFDIKNKFEDSLVGRTVDFEIFPLSFSEFLVFKNKGPLLETHTAKKLEELLRLYTEYALYGGYPKIVLTPEVEKKEKYLQQIIDTYIKKDIRDLALIRDIHKFNQLLEVLASQSGQLLNVAELSNTCGLAKQTIEHYLFLLEATYILKRIVPYSKNLRSELFKTPKVFFYDTGLMQMLWFKGLQKEILGSVFETSVFSELVKKYGVENISFWRTTDKKEIDFILRQKEAILPIEVKLQLAQFQPTAIHYFSKKYSIKKYRVVYLKGEPKHDCDIVPWQL